MDTQFARRARTLEFSGEQLGVVIGSLLGDGTLLETTRGWCFRSHHSARQAAYVLWKYERLRDFVQTPPREYENRIYFRTVSHSLFSSLRAQFYVGRRKVVPLDLLANEMTALALAVWIMDDGSADGHAVRLNTQAFTRTENQALLGLLRSRFGLNATLNRDKGAHRLRVSATDRAKLHHLVGPYILPELAYKLG